MKRLLACIAFTILGSVCYAADEQTTLTLSAGAKFSWETLPDGRTVLKIQGKVEQTDAPVSKVALAATDKPAKPAAGASAAGAQSNPVKEAFAKKGDAAVKDFGNFTVDMSVPASPAFVALGATPETLVNPKSPRDLAVSVISDVTDSTKLGKGVGFDINPYMLFKGTDLQLSTYQQNDGVRLLANTQVSFGAIKQDAPQGSSQASITRASAGLATVLFDADDARGVDSAMAKCFNEKYKALKAGASFDASIQEVLNLQQHGENSEELTEENAPKFVAATKRLSAAFNECRSRYKATSWNSTRWTAGAAQAFHNRGGGTNAGQAGFWTTYSYNLNNDTGKALADRAVDGRMQALLHYRHTNREEVASKTDARGFELRRGDMLGVGFKYGSDKRNFTAEFSVQQGKFDTGGSETSRKLAVGGELMVSKDFWLVATIGGQGGQKNGNNSPFVLGGLKFGSASESTGAFGNGKSESKPK